MGTYDTDTGRPVSPDIEIPQPSDLVEKVLGLLEDYGLPASLNDKIVKIIEDWEENSQPLI